MLKKIFHDSANIQFAPEWFSEKIIFTACAKSLKPWLAMAFAMFAQSVSLSFSRNSIPFMQYAG